MISNFSTDLSIIIPVYNEMDNVSTLCQEIITHLPNPQYRVEIIFVDDGSTDMTVSRLQDLGKAHPNVQVIQHKRNYGQSAALITGCQAAQYPLLVTMDGDGQNDPADIPNLLRQLPDNHTIILGQRAKRNDSVLRKISSRLANWIRQIILRDDCPDTGCSLKLFPRDAFLDLPRFNHMHRYLPALFKRSGFKSLVVPVNHRPRLHGVSKYGVMNRLFVGIHDLIGVSWLLKRVCKPEVIS